MAEEIGDKVTKKIAFMVGFKELLNKRGMCGNGQTMAIASDHRSTALVRDSSWQVLKHSQGEDFII